MKGRSVALALNLAALLAAGAYLLSRCELDVSDLDPELRSVGEDRAKDEPVLVGCAYEDDGIHERVVGRVTDDVLNSICCDLGVGAKEARPPIFIWGVRADLIRPLADTAFHALEFARMRLGLEAPSGKFRVLVCGDVSSARALASEIGLSEFPKYASAAYYRSQEIAIVIDTPRRHESIAHEMAHWLVAGVSVKCPPVLDEGLAMYVAERTTEHLLRERLRQIQSETGDLTFEIRHAMANEREAILREVVRRSEVPTLTSLLRSHRQEVYGSGRRARTIAHLGYCLASVIVEASNGQSTSLATVLSRLQVASDPASEFERIAIRQNIEKVWRLKVQSYRARRIRSDSD